MQSPETPPGDLIQKLGDRYGTLEYLARGGMGAIYTARDLVLDRKVAIKVLVYSESEDRHLVRFQREARTASRLSHPNIVKTMDFGITEANKPYLIMEFIDGESLSQVLDAKGIMSWEPALSLTIQIGKAIAFAHSKSVTHRDLKPSNILIRNYPEDPQVAIIDFGLARMDDQEDSGGKLTRRGTIVGSPLYMSPEQAGGKAGDRQSDVYSLACIAVKMLTGKAPFEGEETFSLLQRKQKEIPVIERPADTSVKWPRGLEDCLARALAPDPQERYRGMSAFIEALERQVNKAGAGDTQTQTQTTDPRNRNRHIMPILGGALLLAVTAATIVWILRLGNDDQPSETPPIGRAPIKFDRRPTESKRSAYLLEAVSTAGVRDEDMKEMKDLFDGVEEVSLEGAAIDGSGLKYLSGLDIVVLNLSGTRVEDANLGYLRDLKSLHQLELQGTTITGAGLKELKGVRNLRRLSLIDCGALKDADLAYIKDTSLSQLDLSRTKITDAGLRELSTATHITDLHLDRTPVTIEGLKTLQHLKLRALQVNNCPNLNGEVLALIARSWPDIEYIGISYIPVSQEQFMHIAACKNLKHMAALDSHLTDADMDVVGNLKELRWLYISDGKFSDAGLENVFKLPNIKALSIHRTPLSRESIESLKRKLPGDCTFLTDQDDKTVEGLKQIGDFLEETGNESIDENPR